MHLQLVNNLPSTIKFILFNFHAGYQSFMYTIEAIYAESLHLYASLAHFWNSELSLQFNIFLQLLKLLQHPPQCPPQYPPLHLLDKSMNKQLTLLLLLGSLVL